MASVLTYVFRYFICHVRVFFAALFIIKYCLFMLFVTVRSVIVFIFTSTSQFGANREYLCAIKCNSFSMTDLWLVNS